MITATVWVTELMGIPVHIKVTAAQHERDVQAQVEQAQLLQQYLEA